MEKIKLEVFGLTYSQTQAGAYALILSIENNSQRIPIIIGGFEAQSIAIELEKLKPPRPLTHDIFRNFAEVFGIILKEVLIYKLEEGIFYSRLYFEKDGEIKELESRTSDAISLALRFNCPIYTIPEIVEKSGIVLDIKDEGQEINDFDQEKEEYRKKEKSNFSHLSTTELKLLMEESIKNEDYETASLIRDELGHREKDESSPF
ncbi:MAG: bifunctional nuclease family protein [Bacteroidales bacterium]|jgi:bifunctional DNase/RNase|nr:bifunctional nuclease family protein [Bacteroidales bacterium]